MSKRYPELCYVLKKLLFHYDMRAIDLAKAANVPQPTVHRLLSGKYQRPRHSSLQALADYFSLSIEQLTGVKPLAIDNQAATNESSSSQIRKIPLIDWGELEELTTARQYSSSYLNAEKDMSPSCFGLTMNDCSMEPMFPEKTALILDPTMQAMDRDYVLVKLGKNDTYTFRQLLIDADDCFIKPLNPDLSQFSMRLLTVNDDIIAKLVEARYRFH